MNFLAPYSFVSAGDLALRLHPAHLSDLRASGLTDQTIRMAGVYSLAPRDIGQFFNTRSGVPNEIESALCFPYQGGQFARIKLFPALGKMKYAQRSGTPARLYAPFQIGDGPIVVTEGEKKTLAAKQAGLNAVGIGGVWSWLSNGERIADLNSISWDFREVTIIPDSDVFGRRDLMRAIYALGREVQALGGNVFIAQIPQPSAEKIGLDDFLVSGGKVDRLEIFSLGHRSFKQVEFWHSRWKFQKTVRAAA